MAWTAVWNEPGARNAALGAFIEAGGRDGDEKERLALSRLVCEAIEQDTHDPEERRLLARTAHLLSREAALSGPLAEPALVDTLIEWATASPFGEEPELQDCALRGIHNVLVHFPDKYDLIHEGILDMMLDMIEHPDFVKQAQAGDAMVVAAALRLTNIALSRSWYKLLPKQVQVRTMDTAAHIVRQLVPPPETPENSWEPTDALGMTLYMALYSIPEDMDGPPELYQSAEHVLLCYKTNDATLLNFAVVHAVGLLTTCRVPEHVAQPRVVQTAEKVSDLLVRIAERYVRAGDGGPTDAAKAGNFSLDTQLAPFWALAARLASSGGVLLETMEPYFFALDKQPPSLQPTLPQWSHMMNPSLFVLISMPVGYAMYMLCHQNGASFY